MLAIHIKICYTVSVYTHIASEVIYSKMVRGLILLMYDENALVELLTFAASEKASDIFITVGSPIMVKRQGIITPYNDVRIAPNDAARIIENIFSLSKGQSYEQFIQTGDSDFSISLPQVARFRVNTFRQRNTLAAVIRVVLNHLPDPRTLGVPDPVMELYKKTRGLVLVTGPTGSGKSTTLACIINLINSMRNCHILTLEDPIEFLHNHKKSIVNQREMESDSSDYAKALRSALRQAPDVILLGEMRDHETISTALTAAETGHLVFSTLHTVGASKTIDRIIDVFSPAQQPQIRVQLASVLQAVVSQQLLQSAKSGRRAVFEVMMVNPAIRNLIRENKVFQIDNMIQTGAAQGMISMDNSIATCVRNGEISREDAFTYCVNNDVMSRLLGSGRAL